MILIYILVMAKERILSAFKVLHIFCTIFFECILAVGHLHGAASELPPFDSQILRVLANNRE